MLAATDLADVLVAEGIPFREAHGVVAGLVRTAVDSGSTLSELDDSEMDGVPEGARASSAPSLERRRHARGQGLGRRHVFGQGLRSSWTSPARRWPTCALDGIPKPASAELLRPLGP